ncbi:hypothetical protein COO72_09060 [Bifidobacterium callitrichos]|nr:hypothetical protein COO72_09060 [Bifidobacterium callitrichos]
MDINDCGGYQYAVQRMSDMRYVAGYRAGVVSPGDGETAWTYDPARALTMESLNAEENDYTPLSTAFAGTGVLREEFVQATSKLDDDIEDEYDEWNWQDEDAWEIGKRVLKPGYRLIRIPMLFDYFLEEDENGVPWTDDHPDPFWDEDGTHQNLIAIRNKVFGEGGAIADEGEDVPADAPWSACSDEELTARLYNMGGFELEDLYQASHVIDRKSPLTRKYLPEFAISRSAEEEIQIQPTSDNTDNTDNTECIDWASYVQFEADFQSYLAQGSRAYCGTIQMSPSTTAQELQEAIDDWDFKTMKLTVLRFRNYGDPTWIPETRTILNGVPLMRESTPEGIMYNIPEQGYWIPARAKDIAKFSDNTFMLYAGFKTEGGKPVPELRSDDDFIIHGGFNYDEAVKNHAFTTDDADASDVFGIWDEVTGWVLPVTDNSVIVWRAFGEGRSNYLNVYDGTVWLIDHLLYSKYYDNDPNDEPEILADIANDEAELKRFVDLGIDPRTVWNQESQQ